MFSGYQRVGDYTDVILPKLQSLFGKIGSKLNLEIEVEKEWPSEVELDGIHYYSPKLDVAVGPFAIQGVFIKEYDKIQKECINLTKQLKIIHNSNFQEYFGSLHGQYPEFLTVPHINLHANSNSRCFLGVEIENKTDRKHMLGAIINVAALSRIGIVVACDKARFKALFTMVGYLEYLHDVNKPSFKTENVLVLRDDQLLKIFNTLD